MYDSYRNRKLQIWIWRCSLQIYNYNLYGHYNRYFPQKIPFIASHWKYPWMFCRILGYQKQSCYFTRKGIFNIETFTKFWEICQKYFLMKSVWPELWTAYCWTITIIREDSTKDAHPKRIYFRATLFRASPRKRM